MIVTVIAIAVIAIGAMGALIWVLDKHEAEREAWATERKQLVDRAIARHAGEVVALDREPKPKKERDPASTVYTEGLT